MNGGGKTVEERLNELESRVDRHDAILAGIQKFLDELAEGLRAVGGIYRKVTKKDNTGGENK